MTRKQAIKRAYEINEMLNKLQNKTNDLINEIYEIEGKDFNDFSLRALRQTLEDFTSFDLEDAILTAE